MGEHVRRELVPIPLCREELAEVKGVHLVVDLVSDAVALDAPVADAEHRAATYDVEAAVLVEELEGRRDLGIFLQLVEEEQRFPRLEALRGVEQGDVAQDARRIVPVVADVLVARLFHKVDLDQVVVCRLGESPDGFGFAHLARPLDDDGESVVVGLPLGQEPVYVTRQIGHPPRPQCNLE